MSALIERPIRPRAESVEIKQVEHITKTSALENKEK